MMVIQYCQTYTDRDDGEILTIHTVCTGREMVSRAVRTENSFTDHANHTVHETDLRIVSRVSL